MRSEDICGNCGAVIPEDSKFCPNCPPKQKNSAPLPVFLVVAVVCSSLLMLSSSVVNVATLPEVKPQSAAAVTEFKPVRDMNVAAYEAAQEFIQEKYPGPKRFSELFQSTVELKGNTYTVTLSADDLSAASPVRYFFSVEMDYVGDQWTLKQIKR